MRNLYPNLVLRASHIDLALLSRNLDEVSYVLGSRARTASVPDYRVPH